MKRKQRALVISIFLAIMIVFTGTYAWMSISQTALNEFAYSFNPGGRLHDDFNGTNKDVYVENYKRVEEGGVPIYARVRLYEYMEIGEDAGIKRKEEQRKATPILPDTNINEPSKWHIHLFHDGTNPYAQYWDLSFGGSTVYMPTFNKDNDSLAADINGTYEGTVENDAIHYDDYKTYHVGDKVESKIQDGNSIDIEGSSSDSIEEHVAKQTQQASVLSMEEWMKKGSPIGNYWVYDSDGWAYWASPIQPEETTGLLLDGIQATQAIQEKYYYAINVVGQFVTKGDWGSKEKGNGFFQTGEEPTEEAMALLSIVSKEQAITITTTDDVDTLQKGESLQCSAAVSLIGNECKDHAITWSVEGNKVADTTIDQDGLLQISQKETTEELMVKATSVKYKKVWGQFKIKVG